MKLPKTFRTEKSLNDKTKQLLEGAKKDKSESNLESIIGKARCLAFMKGNEQPMVTNVEKQQKCYRFTYMNKDHKRIINYSYIVDIKTNETLLETLIIGTPTGIDLNYTTKTGIADYSPGNWESEFLEEYDKIMDDFKVYGETIKLPKSFRPDKDMDKKTKDLLSKEDKERKEHTRHKVKGLPDIIAYHLLEEKKKGLLGLFSKEESYTMEDIVKAFGSLVDCVEEMYKEDFHIDDVHFQIEDAKSKNILIQGEDECKQKFAEYGHEKTKYAEMLFHIDDKKGDELFNGKLVFMPLIKNVKDDDPRYPLSRRVMMLLISRKEDPSFWEFKDYDTLYLSLRNLCQYRRKNETT